MRLDFLIFVSIRLEVSLAMKDELLWGSEIQLIKKNKKLA